MRIQSSPGFGVGAKRDRFSEVAQDPYVNELVPGINRGAAQKCGVRIAASLCGRLGQSLDRKRRCCEQRGKNNPCEHI